MTNSFLRRALIEVMDEPPDQLLSGSALADQEHGGAGEMRHLDDLPHDRPPGRACADQSVLHGRRLHQIIDGTPAVEARLDPFGHFGRRGPRKTSDAPASKRRHAWALSICVPATGTASTRFSRLWLASRTNAYRSSSMPEKQMIPSLDGALISKDRVVMPVLVRLSKMACLAAGFFGPQKWIQGSRCDEGSRCDRAMRPAQPCTLFFPHFPLRSDVDSGDVVVEILKINQPNGSTRTSCLNYEKSERTTRVVSFKCFA